MKEDEEKNIQVRAKIKGRREEYSSEMEEEEENNQVRAKRKKRTI